MSKHSELPQLSIQPSYSSPLLHLRNQLGSIIILESLAVIEKPIQLSSLGKPPFSETVSSANLWVSPSYFVQQNALYCILTALILPHCSFGTSNRFGLRYYCGSVISNNKVLTAAHCDIDKRLGKRCRVVHGFERENV